MTVDEKLDRLLVSVASLKVEVGQHSKDVAELKTTLAPVVAHTERMRGVFKTVVFAGKVVGVLTGVGSLLVGAITLLR
jgi:hypothetical protein